MFERFTNRAQEVIGEAKKAAAQLEQNYIGTEHLLLGLVRVSDSVASKLLQEQGVTEERLEELISSLITPTGSISVREPDGFSPEAYRVIQSSYLEAKRFHSSLVGTEHILISMLKSFDCAGTKLLSIEIKYSSALYRACICKGWRCGSGKGRCGITSVYKKCRK